MGRLSRYRRIKACDPFYKGQKKNEAGFERTNLCPSRGDFEQPVPKTLVRLMKCTESLSQKKKGKKAEEGGASMQQLKQSFKRKDRESVKAYLGRIDVESNRLIMELHRKNRKIREARKRYLETRKKKFEEKRRKTFPSEEEKGSQDRVRFGDVVQAPPKLTAKPRGKVQPQKLLLEEKLGPKGQQGKEEKLVGMKRKQDLEIERQAAIEAYRLAKHQRTLKQ